MRWVRPRNTPPPPSALPQHRDFPTGWRAVHHARLGADAARTSAGRDRADRAGLGAFRATGAELNRSYFLALLAEAHGTLGEPEAGLAVLTEALTRVDITGERWYESEIYRLKGELLLQQNADIRLKQKFASIKPFTSLALNKPSPSSYEPPSASLDSGTSKESARKPKTVLAQSTAGSPKALTPLISRRRRHC